MAIGSRVGTLHQFGHAATDFEPAERRKECGNWRRECAIQVTYGRLVQLDIAIWRFLRHPAALLSWKGHCSHQNLSPVLVFIVPVLQRSAGVPFRRFYSGGCCCSILQHLAASCGATAEVLIAQLVSYIGHGSRHQGCKIPLQPSPFQSDYLGSEVSVGLGPLHPRERCSGLPPRAALAITTRSYMVASARSSRTAQIC